MIQNNKIRFNEINQYVKHDKNHLPSTFEICKSTFVFANDTFLFHARNTEQTSVIRNGKSIFKLSFCQS